MGVLTNAQQKRYNARIAQAGAMESLARRTLNAAERKIIEGDYSRFNHLASTLYWKAQRIYERDQSIIKLNTNGGSMVCYHCGQHEYEVQNTGYGEHTYSCECGYLFRF